MCVVLVVFADTVQKPRFWGVFTDDVHVMAKCKISFQVKFGVRATLSVRNMCV